MLDRRMERHAPTVILSPKEEVRAYLGAKRDLPVALENQNPERCAAYVQQQDRSNLEGVREIAWSETAAYYRMLAAGRDHPIYRHNPSEAEMTSVCDCCWTPPAETATAKSG
jgi:hypothetical protein